MKHKDNDPHKEYFMTAQKSVIQKKQDKTWCKLASHTHTHTHTESQTQHNQSTDITHTTQPVN